MDKSDADCVSLDDVSNIIFHNKTAVEVPSSGMYTIPFMEDIVLVAKQHILYVITTTRHACDSGCEEMRTLW